jgi:hypothetical protein
VTLRASIGGAIPLGMTGGQLRALASLLAAVEAGRWELLARTFDKMDRDGAQLPEPVETLVGRLAAQSRLAARDREEVAQPEPAAVVRGA